MDGPAYDIQLPEVHPYMADLCAVFAGVTEIRAAASRRCGADGATYYVTLHDGESLQFDDLKEIFKGGGYTLW